LPWGLLTLGLLVLIPGDALYRVLLPPAAAKCTRLLAISDRLLLRFLGGLFLTGWLALMLAEANIFNRLTVLVALGGATILLYAAAWRMHGRTGFQRPHPHATAAGAAAGALLLLAGWLYFSHPFETAVGAEDAGIYFNTGGQIARLGGIRLHDASLDEFGNAAVNAAQGGPARHVLLPPPGNDPNTPRFYFLDWQRLAGFNLAPGATNTVTPQFLHLFPTWLALWATFGGGIGAMVYGAPLFGLLGVAITYALGRRLFGALAGLLAALLLACNGLQIWFAREALSEMLLQCLLLGALYAWVIFVEARNAEDIAVARGAALLAGVLLGSTALTHAQFLFALLPLAPLLAWLWLARRWRTVYWWFFAPLTLLLAHATFHIVRYSLGYFEGIYHHVWLDAWHDRGRMALLVVGATALVAVVGLHSLRVRWLPLVTHNRTLALVRGVSATASVLIIVYLYFIRPGILGSATYSLQGYIGAPVPPGAASNLVSLGWYLSPLGLALATLGLALLCLHDFNERGAAILCLAAPFTLLFLTGTYTQGGYIYSLRRFVPLVVPVAALLTAYAAVHSGPAFAALLRRPRLRAPLQALGLAATGLLVLFLAVTTARLVTHREYAGVLDQVAAVNARFGPDDILVFSGSRDDGAKLATPLLYLFGRETWVVTTNQPNGAALDAWLSQQEAAGRHVHLLLSNGGGKLLLPEHRLAPAGTIQLDLLQFEKLDNQKPYNQQHNRLSYAVYDLQPLAAGENPLGALPYQVEAGQADEPAQIQGFYDVETAPGAGGGPVAYRWTDGEALLRIPWPGDGRPLSLTLTLSAGPRPAQLGPATVVVGLRPDPGSVEKEQPLAVLTVGSDFTTYQIDIPAHALPPTADGTAVLHLGIPREFKNGEWKAIAGSTWRPSDYPAASGGSLDSRPLHVRFVRAELAAK
jgi:4-amino-4-deoxy-L-arabinose transferase-like glycosyltransferase